MFVDTLSAVLGPSDLLGEAGRTPQAENSGIAVTTSSHPARSDE
jgi:hypothetical protein